MIKFSSIILNITAIVLLISTASFRCTSNDDIQQEILNYIKVYSQHTKISLSLKPIRFNTVSVSESVLSTNYIKGFSYSNDNIVKSEQLTITKVEDSLKTISLTLNNQCSKQYSGNLPKVKKDDGYILFLSPVCSGVVYAELINSSSIIVNSNQYEFFGEAKTFVFLIEDSKIKQVYKGSITYN